MVKLKFKRSFIFLDNKIRDYDIHKAKLPKYTEVEQNIFNTFELNKSFKEKIS
jgi:hypothetical protein